jgi:hypothetical protein
VLRVSGAETDRWISDAGLAELLGQIPEEYVKDLPEPQHAAVNAVMLRGRSSGTGSRVRLARRLAWHALLERCTQTSPVLILIDDAQWLDAASADVIAFAARRTAGGGSGPLSLSGGRTARTKQRRNSTTRFTMSPPTPRWSRGRGGWRCPEVAGSTERRRWRRRP